MNLRTAAKIIKMAEKANISTILLGSPGIGKSSIFLDLARQAKREINIFEGVSLDPTDVRGLTFPDDNNGCYFAKSPMYPTPGSILLIDDLTASVDAVQISLHTLFLNRRLGTYKIPDDVMICATGNRPEDDSGASDLLRSLEDRLLILNIEPSLEIWIEDFALNYINSSIIGFLKSFPHRFCTKEDRWVSPRSYARLSAMLDVWEDEYASDKNENDTRKQYELLREIATASIGEVVGKEFHAYYTKYRDLPPVDEILKKTFIPSETDVLYGILFSIAKYSTVNKKAQVEILKYMKAIPKDFALLLLISILRTDKTYFIRNKEIACEIGEYFKDEASVIAGAIKG